MIDLAAYCVKPDDSIRAVMAQIDANRKQIALVVDDERRLLGTITDGDIRRAILAGVNLGAAASAILLRKAGTAYGKPTSAHVGTPRADLLRVMREKSVRQMPLLDDEGRLVDLITIEQIVPVDISPLQAVIMAGGYGKRLRPLTEDIPKPMLRVGDRPLMQRIIEQLRDSGIRRVSVTTHYMPEKITDYFGDGHNFGVELNYVAEDCPLGTAGALGLLDRPSEPLLVVNGDILTRVDFRAMQAYHREHEADLTVAVRQYELQVPYGVIENEGERVAAVTEKPRLTFLVNAGIYLLEPSVHKFIAPNERLDMPDLIRRLVADGKAVVSYPVVEYWLDIGQLADYEQAQSDARDGRWSK